VSIAEPSDTTVLYYQHDLRGDPVVVTKDTGERLMLEGILNNRFAPTTSDIGFIDEDAEIIAQEFIEWQQPLVESRGVRFKVEARTGSLEELLAMLWPLTSVERRRYLFVPTQSKWTAFFDNGWRGGDPASTVSALCEIHSHRGVRLCFTPHKLSKGVSGATIMEVYGPEGRPILNTERSVYVAHNGSKWEFGESGEPFPFEKLEKYTESPVQHRFTSEMLSEYMLNFDIRAFDTSFYTATTEKPAMLVEKLGPNVNGLKEYPQVGML